MPENLNIECHNVEYGTQVRRFFEEDLNRIDPGICFLPEWICHSMTQAALSTRHRVVFYRVNRMKDSLIPLEADWVNLIHLIVQNECRYSNLIVLAAFPLGYIDHRMQEFWHFLRKKQVAKIHLFLDLSQSYGTYPFANDLTIAHAIYISLNGNKLIDSGGAFRIAEDAKPTAKFQLPALLEWIDAAFREQEKKWQITWGSIVKFWQGNPGELIERFSLYNKSWTRSSYHRTVLLLSTSSSMSQQFIQEGYGQTIHPNPQHSLCNMSAAYEEWKRNSLLLFPQKRVSILEGAQEH